jgi:predicted tellurium resistance membrane protein TerC
MAEYFDTPSLIALLTLTSLEIVLGIDNIIFIAILAGRTEESQRDRARRLGLLLAVVSRVALVLAIGWVMTLTRELFNLFGRGFTGKDLILIAGGGFLMFKATREIHHKMQTARSSDERPPGLISLQSVLLQVLMIDVVFSLDSVITAVGMTGDLKHPIPVMIAAILLSVAAMLVFSKAIVLFIEKNPAIKILALSFLLLIGMLLVAEGCGQHINKGYVYFAMAFSFGVEMLQLWTVRPTSPQAPESQY